MSLLILKSNKLLNLLNLHLCLKTSCLYLYSSLTVLKLQLPSFYFFKNTFNSTSFIFLNKFFYKSFTRHLFTLYNRFVSLYFFKLRITGLGYRIRKISSSLYCFFFHYTNFFYFYIPKNFFAKSYKKRIIFLSNNWFLLKLILSHILLLKKLGPYSLRGLRYMKQIIYLKKSQKI